MASSETARRALAELLPGDYLLVPAGVDTARFAPPAREPGGSPGLVVIARGRERAGVRFACRVLRSVDLERLGPVTVLGAAEAPWRTRAAVPKSLRWAVTAVADDGAEARAEAFGRGRIVLVATPEDAAGGALVEAMASGLAVIAPRCEDLEGVLTHGREGLALPPFSLEAWAAAVRDLAGDPERRAELGAAAAERGAARSWAAVAAELEDHYRAALAARGAALSQERIVADLRVRPAPGVDAAVLVAACLARGVGAVAVAAPGGLEPALAVAAAAPPELAVVVGQEVATGEGTVVGLFLRDPLEDGLGLPETLDRVHAQGGLVMVPSPAAADAPAPDLLRRHAAAIDCYETASGPANGPGGDEASALAQRLGLLATAGSAASGPDEVGLTGVRMRPFRGPEDFLDGLASAELTRRRKGLRARAPRQRRRPRPAR